MTPSSFCTMQPHKGNVWWLNTAIRKNEWNGASPARQKAGSSWEWIAQDTAHKSFQRAPDTPSIPPLPKGLWAAATTQGGLEPPATIPARRGAGDTPGPPRPAGPRQGQRLTVTRAGSSSESEHFPASCASSGGLCLFSFRNPVTFFPADSEGIHRAEIPTQMRGHLII